MGTRTISVSDDPPTSVLDGKIQNQCRKLRCFLEVFSRDYWSQGEDWVMQIFKGLFLYAVPWDLDVNPSKQLRQINGTSLIRLSLCRQIRD